MPRWLSSLLIIIGFLALVALAFVPRNVTVIVDVDSLTEIHTETTNNHDGAVPALREPDGAIDNEQ